MLCRKKSDIILRLGSKSGNGWYVCGMRFCPLSQTMVFKKKWIAIRFHRAEIGVGLLLSKLGALRFNF